MKIIYSHFLSSILKTVMVLATAASLVYSMYVLAKDVLK
jgi:hypothetical protein